MLRDFGSMILSANKGFEYFLIGDGILLDLSITRVSPLTGIFCSFGNAKTIHQRSKRYACRIMPKG